MARIVDLPYELVILVIRHLLLDDIYSLALACKRFLFLIGEEKITKWLLQTRAPFSAEAIEAQQTGKYARQLRRLLKRREAIITVSPFLVASVAYAHEWRYANGVLCYTRGTKLHVLDLHRSTKSQVLIDMKALIHDQLGAWHQGQKYGFEILHYSDSIVSLLYKQAVPGLPGHAIYWLLVLTVSDQQLTGYHQLPSVSNIVVRNNQRFLYYGTTSDPNDEGDEFWKIGLFDIHDKKWYRQELLEEAIGTDLGSTVCFEIFDNDLYILSSQRRMYVEYQGRGQQDRESQWESYYFCGRYSPGPDHDGYFTILRAEHPPDRTLWRRNHKQEGPLDNRGSSLCLVRNETTGQLQAIECRQEYLPGSASTKRTYYTTPIEFGGSENAADQAALAPRIPRNPHLVQPCNDTSAISIPLSRRLVCSYHPGCQAFIDLVDTSDLFEPEARRLCIRGGSRRLGPSGEQYEDRPTIFWPPEPGPEGHDAAALAALFRVLNPPGFSGKPFGSFDDRSMVYSAGTSKAGLHALILISWDPAIHLPGTRAYRGLGISRDKPEKTATIEYYRISKQGRWGGRQLQDALVQLQALS
ncbi:hypothetical protein VTJ04DRAFT_9862 [Mycothermus thermophilus]|uniref:uncharacterized protein n=1 Tax=Humicola insolens TaxID=85995 RepID=UPI0037427001